jgi:hypothetical protein
LLTLSSFPRPSPTHGGLLPPIVPGQRECVRSGRSRTGPAWCNAFNWSKSLEISKSAKFVLLKDLFKLFKSFLFNNKNYWYWILLWVSLFIFIIIISFFLFWLLIFLFGGISSLFLQVIVSRLALKKPQSVWGRRNLLVSFPEHQRLPEKVYVID